MRKSFMSFIVASFIFFLAIAPVAANTAEIVEEDGSSIIAIETLEVEEEVLTPDSPFYFLKRFMEQIRVLLTFDQETKVTLLDELAAERAKELDALEYMYEEGELNEEEVAMLEKALDDLILYTERLVGQLAELDGESDEGVPEDHQELEFEEEVEGIEEEPELDKYQLRIAHLQAIADRAPEAAQNGLARAMANAERERAMAKGKMSDDDSPSGDVENGDPESSELVTVELENIDLENDEDENEEGPPAWAPQHAKDQWEWSQTNQDGPPPWAKGNGKNNNKGKGKSK
ncbi:MAG: DUF5667 domain-containing protein [Firmicutes bacterium]|nr:DUF5667 domain-containing protein [Bacillota bacterium]